MENILNKYVWNENIYGSLMSGNIALNFYTHDKRVLINQEIQAMVLTANDELIDNFLNLENWRAKLIAGYLIGFKNRKKYIPQIGELLLSGCGGVTGYCYALAKFADDESINYLTSYLDKHLLVDTFPKETFQDWVFLSLRWIDKINGTHIAKSYLGEDGLWNKFVNFEIKTSKTWKLSNYDRWGCLEKRDNNFEKMMIYYKENFEEKK